MIRVIDMSREGCKCMENKSYLCLQPVYMNQFQCDGSVCKSKCCKNWTVDIDGNTYQRYCGIKSKEERKRITSKLKLVNRGAGKCFTVKLRKDGSCPFLRDDYFCELQKNYGESFLSRICATYPRTIHRLDEIIERSLTLSCPVAAKLILLQKNPMEFEQVEIVENRPMQADIWNMKNRPLGVNVIDLQYGCISILQNRRLTLDQRLILMGFFLEQVDEIKDKPDEVKALAEGYASDEVAEGALELIETFSCKNEKDYIRCMFEMVETLYGKGKSLSIGRDWVYLDALTKLYRFLDDKEGFSEVVSLDKLVETYEGYRSEANDIIRQYSYIFENCMVNEFFLNLYPLKAEGTVTENYIDFIMRYKFMEFLTIALAVVRKDEPKEEVLTGGLGFFSERMDHSKAYRSHISDQIQSYNKDMKFFMRTLLDGRS